MVFIPGLGFTHGGGTRWINLFGFSLQPGEILKFSSIIMTSWFIYKFQNKLDNIFISIGIFGSIVGACAAAMFLQKDLGTLVILSAACFTIYFIGGAKIRHIALLGIVGTVMIAAYAYMNPYIMSRLNVFSNKTNDTLGSSYQTKQALIGVSAGGIAGRGIGQSIQKFSYLPEPVGDSIFAVTAEEFGLIGSTLTIFLFGFIIVFSVLQSEKQKNQFARSLIIGLAALFFTQTILNIASMIGLIPLSGDILPFFSQGGTALIVNMFQLGLLLQLTKRKI
jgi:cell division protein FtsW